jgi:hypothetical protein
MGCLRGTPRRPTPCGPVGNPLPGVSHPELRHVFGARDLDRPSSRASCWVVISSRCGLVPVGPGGGLQGTLSRLAAPRPCHRLRRRNERPPHRKTAATPDVCDKNTRRGGSLAMNPTASQHSPAPRTQIAGGRCARSPCTGPSSTPDAWRELAVLTSIAEDLTDTRDRDPAGPQRAHLRSARPVRPRRARPFPRNPRG